MTRGLKDGMEDFLLGVTLQWSGDSGLGVNNRMVEKHPLPPIYRQSVQMQGV